jgi:hypothetical protein
LPSYDKAAMRDVAAMVELRSVMDDDDDDDLLSLRTTVEH